APARAAGRDHDARARHDEVVRGAVPIRHLRAGRETDDVVVAACAVAQGALPVTAALGLVVRPALEALKVAHRVVAEQDDIPAAATVAAVGAAVRDMGLTAERADPVPAGPALNEDASLVVQHVPQPSLERTSWRTTRARSSSSRAHRPASAPRPRASPSRRGTASSSPRGRPTGSTPSKVSSAATSGR